MSHSPTKGFTLAELIISIGIMIVIGFAVSQFIRNIFILNSGVYNSLTAQLEGRKILKIMVAELRTIAPSALGSYPLDTVATSTLIFYADINGNGSMDRIRYFLDQGSRTLKKGVVSPSGNPSSYNLNSETVTTLVTEIVNGTSTPMFDYYDSTYAGTTTPLSIPVTPSAVRLIKVTVLIDKDPNRSPNTISIVTEVAPRNIKDNL
ncbi:MAG: hypothetical protein JWN89_541 [Parcubacteria group bacterium]|nr:hypothetical protein [Parcubacteria group bacterium]